MTVREIYAKLDQLAPKSLSDEYCRTYGAYDNSGILVDCGGDVDRVLFTLDLTSAAIAKAKEIGAKLIVTHHPVIYGKIGDVRMDTSLGGRLISCIQGGISVISMHLNLDCAKGGIDDCLADGIYRAAGGLDGAGTPRSNLCRYHTLSQGGYGSVFTLPEITAERSQAFAAQVWTTARLALPLQMAWTQSSARTGNTILFLPAMKQA